MTPSLGLDHLYLRVHDSDAVLEFFRVQLGLPVSWPLRDEPFARYAWVNAGNVQIEIWQARTDEDLPPGTQLPLVAGLGLWPADVEASRNALEAKEVRCKEPRAWRTRGADGERLNFTNCVVLDASGPACQVFFCEWDPNAPIVPWPKGESTAHRRGRWANELAQAEENRLGIERLRAVHLQTPDGPRHASVWNAIAGAPGIAAPDVALVLEAGRNLQVTALVFGVRDLQRAHAALDERGWRGESCLDVLWLDSEQTHGMRIGLTG